MSACSHRHLVEFRARRIWCTLPWLEIDSVALLLGMTVPTFRQTLFYIEDLSAETVIEYGKQRLRESNSRNARVIGFLHDGYWDEI